MSSPSSHRPHGHHHGHEPHPHDRAAKAEAESQAQPHVDARAPEREEVRDAIETLEERVAELTAQLEAEHNARLRAVADFQNFQRRAQEQEARMLASGVVAAARNLIPVLDHFDLALTCDPSTMDAKAAYEGLGMLRSELVRALEKSGVEVIAPKAGDVFDPKLHEAIMQQPTPGITSGHVASTFQAGYRIGEIIIRAAKVGVAP